MNEETIEQFWNTHPCGADRVSVLDKSSRQDYERFFVDYDQWKLGLETHIPACLDRDDWRDKRVLEVGPGEGLEAEQLIRRGAIWSGIDLTQEAIDRSQMRLTLRSLPFDRLEQGSVLSLPFDDDSFDIVFSHGVLHHVPDILQAQREIHRVLRPDGHLLVMMYARWSLNYLVAIGVVRRAAVLAAYPFLRGDALKRDTLLAAHVRNARRDGLFRYLKMSEFIHKNTDGPLNPFSRVYDRRSLERDFPDFAVVDTYKRFMHAPPLPVHGLPGDAIAGWHLWARLAPKPGTP
jgi:SAM-dependent methyltransferase